MAAAERVDERTVRRWIEKGAVKVRRTPGGGVRIAVHQRTSSDNSRHPSE
jgi:predicted site-specific integrase-resolvase